MDVLPEAIRCVAAISGATAFLTLNQSSSWRASLAMVVPGSVAGVFLAPLLCDGLAMSGWAPWINCGTPHVDCGIAVLVGFLGHGGASMLLVVAPAWLRQKLGLPEPPPPPIPTGRPDSDIPKANGAVP